jgi:hypothetical protein
MGSALAGFFFFVYVFHPLICTLDLRFLFFVFIIASDLPFPPCLIFLCSIFFVPTA